MASARPTAKERFYYLDREIFPGPLVLLKVMIKWPRAPQFQRVNNCRNEKVMRMDVKRLNVLGTFRSYSLKE
jgi:hypothetical protein